MNSFKKRERGFENKFAHDEEMRFKAHARRNKLAGLWAADLMGKSGEAATDYAMEVVKADFEKVGPDAAYKKLVRDLGDLADKKTIRTRLEECHAEAKVQIMTQLK